MAKIIRTALKAGRNEPCPCGSGKKFKKCCGPGQQQRSRFAGLMLAIIAAAVFGGLLYSISSRGEERASATPGVGRVWSPEHGHYH
jgi:hypothetical protein